METKFETEEEEIEDLDVVDEVNDAVKEAEPMLKKFVVRLLPALADSL